MNYNLSAISYLITLNWLKHRLFTAFCKQAIILCKHSGKLRQNVPICIMWTIAKIQRPSVELRMPHVRQSTPILVSREITLITRNNTKNLTQIVLTLLKKLKIIVVTDWDFKKGVTKLFGAKTVVNLGSANGRIYSDAGAGTFWISNFSVTIRLQREIKMDFYAAVLTRVVFGLKTI